MALENKRCSELADLLVKGDSTGSSMFVSFGEFREFLQRRGLHDDVPDDIAGHSAALHVVNYYNSKDIVELLETLEDEAADGDHLARVREFLEEARPTKPRGIWFFHGIKALAETDAVLKSGALNVFDEPAKWTPRKLLKRSDLDSEARHTIDEADAFVAVVSDRYTQSHLHPEVFEYAFDRWLNRLDRTDRAHARFVALLCSDSAKAWWDEKFASKVPVYGESDLFRRRINVENDAEMRDLKVHLAEFIANRNNGAARAAASRIILLDHAAANAGAADSGLTAIAAQLARDYPDYFEAWEPGWSTRPLQGERRQQLLSGKPLFVREVADSAATLSGARGLLCNGLLGAIAPGEAAERAWPSLRDATRRVLWRPGGPDWDDVDLEPGEYAETWQIDAAAAELASLAGIKGARVVRYEEPVIRDAGIAQLGQRELVEKLQSIARFDTNQDAEVDTVRISFDDIKDSVRRFSPTELNILAVHDLETKLNDKLDIMAKFARVDRQVDFAIRDHFGDHEPKILRVAVLFANGTYEGRGFGEESLLRWDFLKWVGEGTAKKFEDKSITHLKLKAATLLGV